MQKYSTNAELMHYGVKGMKWGVRRYQNKDGSLNSSGRKRYQSTSSDSAVTKKVKKDLASLSGSEFRKKYGTSNTTYMKRVEKYGDPYMNAPLAKMGNFLKKQAQKNAARRTEKEKAYLKEVCDTWMSDYKDQAIKDFGRSPIDYGEEWATVLPTIYMYDEMARES